MAEDPGRPLRRAAGWTLLLLAPIAICQGLLCAPFGGILGLLDASVLPGGRWGRGVVAVLLTVGLGTLLSLITLGAGLALIRGVRGGWGLGMACGGLWLLSGCGPAGLIVLALLASAGAPPFTER